MVRFQLVVFLAVIVDFIVAKVQLEVIGSRKVKYCKTKRIESAVPAQRHYYANPIGSEWQLTYHLVPFLIALHCYLNCFLHTTTHNRKSRIDTIEINKKIKQKSGPGTEPLGTLAITTGYVELLLLTTTFSILPDII